MSLIKKFFNVFVKSPVVKYECISIVENTPRETSNDYILDICTVRRIVDGVCVK